MHPNFWKYFAIISVSACILVIVTWLLWPSGSTGSETKNELRTEEMVEEILKAEEPIHIMPFDATLKDAVSEPAVEPRG